MLYALPLNLFASMMGIPRHQILGQGSLAIAIFIGMVGTYAIVFVVARFLWRPLNQLGCYAVLSSGGVGSNIQAILDRWACFGGSYVRRSRRSPLRTAART
jgi:ethanolamine transporter EutH